MMQVPSCNFPPGNECTGIFQRVSQATWETEEDPDSRDEARRADWLDFAQLLGQHELNRLGLDFHLRPPGAV